MFMVTSNLGSFLKIREFKFMYSGGGNNHNGAQWFVNKRFYGQLGAACRSDRIVSKVTWNKLVECWGDWEDISN